ncbi:MAG: arginine--tRNA ligase [Bacillota bacterium]|nr:arginine--tRNA ligase [Bacillota bacterium]MDW7729067.1 arginine--tRNA ligase [Bacillota bacterium]
MQKLKEEIGHILSPLVDLDPAEVVNLLEVPPESEYGDYAFPCYTLAKKLKKAPPLIAVDLAEKLSDKKGRYWSKAEPRGPYLNFYLAPAAYGREVLQQVWDQGDKYGHTNLGLGRNVPIDYSSPNIAKPFGVGHIRSTVIGHSLYLIFKALGYNSIGINHLGDWGTQFGKLIVAFELWGEEEKLEADPVDYLYKLYVRFHQEAEKDANLDDEARSWFKRLEEGDQEAVSYWNRFRKLSLENYALIYDLLGIEFEHYHGESHYNEMLDQVIELVKDKGIAKESEGALIVDLEQHGLPPVMLRKKDGATLYITRDLAAAIYRHDTFDFALSLYVVGAEQVLHFQQLFKLLELMGFEWAKNCVHVPFGLIRFKEGRMSTRAGKIILLEEVLRRSIDMAREIIEEKNPDLDDKESAAKAVGLGAVRFGDLSNDRIKNIEFDWEKVLDFSGETAAYIQYAHARICSIMRKAGAEQKLWNDSAATLLVEEEETVLIKTLAMLPDKIIASADNYRPSILARYLIDVAREFNRFYHNCPVLSSEGELQQGRLLLISATRQVIANGLALLGIVAPEEM